VTGATPDATGSGSSEAVAAGEAPTGAGPIARSLARAGLIVTLAVVASRVLGYVRVAVIGWAIPEVRELDAFFAAFRIPDLLFQLVAAGALSSSLVPVLAGLFASDEEQRAWRVVSTVLTLMLAALAVLAALVLVFADVLVPPIMGDLDPVATARTVELTRIMVLSPLFLAAGAVATSVLNATGRFGASAIAPLVYNLAIIGAAVLLAPTMGVVGLAVGVVAGALGHVLVQVPALRRHGVRIRLMTDLRDPAARTALALLGPRAIGLASVQLVFVVATGIAAGLQTGAITAFNFAFTLLQIPIGVIGVPLGIVLLPSLARHAAVGEEETFRRMLIRALRLLAFVMVPIAGLGMVVAADVVRMLFGAVADPVLDLTAETLVVFLAGLTGHSLIAVLARAFYARQDTKTPVAAALVSVALDIALALLLSPTLGLAGVAAAIAIGAWVETAILAILLERRIHGLGLGSVVRVLLATLLISAVAVGAAWLVERTLVDAWGRDPGALILLLRAAIVTTVGGLVVLAGAVALRIPELPAILEVVTDLVRRRGRA
jgi:putative peptidoglycan lipid II flippase